MKNLFKFVVFGVLAFSRVEGCQKCFDDASYYFQAIDVVVDRSLKDGENPSEDYIIGIREGLRIGLKHAMKIINRQHPETNPSIDNWENILNKKIPASWIED